MNEILELTMWQAVEVKKMRTVNGYSWRRIAEVMAREYPELDLLAGNQIEGRELCISAAFLLGEDYRNWDK